MLEDFLLSLHFFKADPCKVAHSNVGGRICEFSIKILMFLSAVAVAMLSRCFCLAMKQLTPSLWLLLASPQQSRTGEKIIKTMKNKRPNGKEGEDKIRILKQNGVSACVCNVVGKEREGSRALTPCCLT